MQVNNHQANHIFSTKPTRFFPAALLATVFVVLLYYWHNKWSAPLPPKDQIIGFFNLTALRFKLFASGPIPYTIAWTFGFGVAYLGQIWRKKIIPLTFSNVADNKVVQAAMAGDDSALIKCLQEQHESGVSGYYGSRLLKLRSRYIDKDMTAVIALKNDILEVDEEEFALSFTAVLWCEAALPLLGFLGTVVGIGGALGGIQNAVQLLFSKSSGSGVNLNEQVVTMFGQGFQDLAVAFDTTFLGLMSLIVLGVFHNFVKKNLAIQLAKAREVFRDVVANWTGEGNNPMVVAIGDLDDRLTSLQEAIAALEGTVQNSDQRAVQFRENIKDMAERVILEDNNLSSVRNVLFRPIIEFRQAEAQLTERIQTTLDQHIKAKNWHLIDLAISTADPGTIAIAARHKKGEKTKYYTYFFSMNNKSDDKILDTTQPVETLIMAYPPANVLALDDSGNLLAIDQNGSDLIIAQDLNSDELVLPTQNNTIGGGLIIRNQGHAFSTQMIDLKSKKKLIGSPHQLSMEATWSIWNLHLQSATLFTAGKSQDKSQPNWFLQILSLSPGKKANDTKKKRPKTDNMPILVKLPTELIPQQIIGLSTSEVVILDTKGVLHYWETKRLSPVRLSHPSWDIDPKCVIRSGKNGWLAVAAKERLKMWRVRKGGFLYPYDSDQTGYAITALSNPETLVATADGRYLLGLTGKMIIVWEFPQYTLDQS